MLKKLLPYICEGHIKDGLDNGPSVLLGEENSSSFESIQVLKARNYNGWLLLENSCAVMTAVMKMSPEDVRKKDIDTVKGCLQS